MADIFSDVVNFAGATLKQTITPDTVRDYTHASKLFVGDQYRLVPKTGFLFHLFIDVNSAIADPQNPNSMREIGLMVKSADLPRFSTETKTYNSYNRANIVQSKIRYDPINIIFYDDSSNLIRNFWTSYFKHYYRDSDYALNQYSIPHKYSEQTLPNFGFSPRREIPFLKCIRLYSLHQKRFSEYILINPVIKSFRHGNHGQDKISDTLQHEMTIEYESVLYNSGRTSAGNPKGFAELHYDTTPSPITPLGGGPKSVFGPGGLFDTGRDVLEDIDNGNYGAALFKAARGINNARGMDLKSRAISEITDQFNRTIKESVSAGQIMVPNILGTSSVASSPFNGIDLNSSAAALAGVVALNQTRVPAPLSTQKINDIRQSTASNFTSQLTNYNNSFPPNPGVTTSTSTSSSLTLLNDQDNTRRSTGQGQINISNKQQELTNKIQSSTQSISQTTVELANARNQIANATAALSLLTAKLNAALALPDTNPNKDALIEQANQSIAQQQQIKSEATSLAADKSSKLDNFTQELQALRAEKDAIK